MDFIRNLPLFTIVLSLFSGALCFMLGGRAARRWTMILETSLVLMSAAVLWYTSTTGEAFTYTMGEFPAPWGNEIRAGVLEALFAVVFSTILLVSVIAGARYVDIDMDESKVNLYYALLDLLSAAIMSLLWTNDIFTGYVFLEILTLTSCGLLIVREVGRTTLAAIRYMILNLLGSGLFLLGVALLYDVTGNLLMVPMRITVDSLTSDASFINTLTLSLGILTIGLAIKSGLFPFHFWMPDTYGYATPTSGSVLSSLVSKGYILLLFKIYARVIGLGLFERMPIRDLLLVLGICGMVFGSISAIRADNINRMVAFSSAAQIGYIYMGIGLGGQYGYTAAMFHILAHALTKSLLFLTTPRLSEVSGESMRFKALQGSALRDRRAGFFFLIGSLSMIGIPIFAGFSSKLLFGYAAVSSGSELKLIAVMLALACSSLLNAIYFIRTLIRVYNAPDPGTSPPAQSKPHRGGYAGPMLILTAGNLFLGLFSPLVIDLISKGLAMFG